MLLWILVLTLLMVEVVGFCPEGCICNDTVLTVHCIRTDLQVRGVLLYCNYDL
jgi:hypothetical protein